MKHPENMTLKGTLEQRGKKKRSRQPQAEPFAVAARGSLLLAVILSPWAFGSVHHWPQQWISIFLLFGLGLWWFETAMNSGRKQVFPYVSLLVISGLIIGLVQLLPLPDAIADAVLGRQKEIYQNFSGESNPSFRFSLDREGTWGQLRMLTMALCGMLLGCRYFRSSRDLITLLTVCTANGVLLAFIGIIQKLTYSGKILWTFEVLMGSPFGPFVNRNNAAGYLLLCLAGCMGLLPIVMSRRKSDGPQPMVSREMPFWRQYYFIVMYFIAELTATKLAVLIAAVLISSGIVGTVSRGGVLALLTGCIGTIVIYGMARRPKNSSVVLLPLVLLVFALTGWVGFGEQVANRFSRIDMVDVSASDARVQHWRDTAPAISEMGWLGSGLGSYRGVHRLYRSDREVALFDFAENQFFQAAVEAGWPGLIIFVLAWLLVFHYSSFLLYRGQSANSIGVGTCGIFLVFSQATASMFDFGLYIPANMLLMSVLVGFLAYHAHSLSGRLKKPTWLKFEVPNYVMQVGLLILFASLTVVALDFYRRSRLDMAMTPPIENLDYRLTEESIDRRIELIERQISKCRSVAALNYLAELRILRARVAFLNSLQAEDEFRNAVVLLDDEEKRELTENVWDLTTLQRMQENAFYLRNDISNFQAARFLSSSFIRENLPPAVSYLVYSRHLSPLQPVVHIRLAQIAGVIGEEDAGVEDMERAIQLAPNNPNYRMIAGVFYLQNGDEKAAGTHLRRYLELLPNSVLSVIEMLKGKTSRRVQLVGNREIFDYFLPDDPKLLYRFSKKWLADDPEVRQLVLTRADELLSEVPQSRVEKLLLRADIRLDNGDLEGALNDLQLALKSNPMDGKSRFRLADLLFQQGKSEQALEEAKKLLDLNRKNQAYNALISQIEEEIRASKD